MLENLASFNKRNLSDRAAVLQGRISRPCPERNMLSSNAESHMNPSNGIKIWPWATLGESSVCSHWLKQSEHGGQRKSVPEERIEKVRERSLDSLISYWTETLTLSKPQCWTTQHPPILHAVQAMLYSCGCLSLCVHSDCRNFILNITFIALCFIESVTQPWVNDSTLSNVFTNLVLNLVSGFLLLHTGHNLKSLWLNDKTFNPFFFIVVPQLYLTYSLTWQYVLKKWKR